MDPIGQSVAVIVNDTLSPQAQSAAVAAFARTRLLEAASANRRALGRVPPYKTIVDGRPGAAPEAVRPKGGVIVFEFELITDVLRWVLETLVARSPVVSGRYRDSHTSFADGRPFALGTVVPQAAEYSVLNTVPYARKIEIGKTKSGRAFVIQVPNKIYERTAREARARFGNIAKITFTYRGLAAGQMTYPTIVVVPN